MKTAKSALPHIDNPSRAESYQPEADDSKLVHVTVPRDDMLCFMYELDKTDEPDELDYTFDLTPHYFRYERSDRLDLAPYAGSLFFRYELTPEHLHLWALSQAEKLESLQDRAFPPEEVANWAREAAAFLLQYREHQASVPAEKLTLPAKAPVRWADRARFAVAGVQDGHTRRKLEQNPGLVREIRECRPDNALRFLDIVYGDYIRAGLMYQTDLAGQKRTATNPSPRPALDKRLFDLCAAQCAGGAKRLSAYLPTASQRVDRELERFGTKDINRLQSAMTRRKALKLKKKNAPDSARPG